MSALGFEVAGGVDFAAAKSVLLSSVVGQSIKLVRTGREFTGLCPFHDERSPSLTVNDEKGFYHCFGCGAHGDAADFVAAIAGCGLREAVERLGIGDLPRVESRLVERKSETADAAKAIWRHAVAIEGTPAAAYLFGRGITMKLPPSLRYARLRYPDGQMLPALVAAVISPARTLAGIQRIFVTPDGRKADVPNPKLSLGRIAGNAIRLGPPAAELIVCEGLEDALSLQQELGRVVWAAAGASMLSSMQFPDAVRSVVIARDNDNAGEREANKAATAFAERGLRVRIMVPEQPHKDWNQQLIASAVGRAA